MAEPKTAAPKKAKKKTTDKKDKRSADRAEKANTKSADPGTSPATNTQENPGTPADSTDKPSTGSITTTTPDQGTTNGNTENQADNDLSYDDPASTAAGTTVGAKLNNLVAELNKLAGQYDVAAFNSGLASVQARNNQLMAQSTTWADRNLATKINGTIERMRADPENAQYIVGHIWH